LPANGLKSIVDLAFDATLRVAAPRQPARRSAQSAGPLLRITETDLRERVYERKIGNLILFAVDASGSMAARKRMVAVKGAVLSLLLDAYQKRDRVGLVAFRGTAARLLLPPTNSVERAERELRALPTGGRTPLAQALRLCAETLRRPLAAARGYLPWLVLVSDGRPNVPLREGDALADACRVAEQLRASGIRALVIDTEEGPVRLGLNRRIAAALGAEYLRLEELAADAIETAVRRRVMSGGTSG
jgi:magnesium chelatase subunit D